MTIDAKILNEKLQYDIKREARKISALPSTKADKNGHLAGKEILPSNRSQIIEPANFTYTCLRNVLEEQTKEQGNALKF